MAVLAFGIGTGFQAVADDEPVRGGAEEEVGLEVDPEESREKPGLIEEIIVTGSYLRGTSEAGPSPVDVVQREDIELFPVTSLVEVVTHLPYNTGSTTAGMIGQFTGDSGGRANVNLHGLGPAQTLILLNGKRNVVNPDVIAGGQTYVNIDQFPKIMMERVEVLKEGAAATYGSDAVAGVANFITRRNFEGFEFRTDYTDKFKNNGYRTYNIEGIVGWANEKTHIVAAATYNYSDRYRVADAKSWSTTHTGSGLGESTFGNPGSFLHFDSTPTKNGAPSADNRETIYFDHPLAGIIPIGTVWDQTLTPAFQANGVYTQEELDNGFNAAGSFDRLPDGRALHVGTNGMAFTQDPQCAEGGGTPYNSPANPFGTTVGYRCSYAFAPFFDISSERYRWNGFLTFDHEFSEYAKLYVDASYSRAETDHIGLSPSFPILNFDRDAVVPASNPGNYLGTDVTYFGRPIAAALGGPLNNRSDGGGDSYIQKYVLGLKGDLPLDLPIGEDWHYDVSLLYNRIADDGRAPDQRVSLWNNALWGFGGSNCTAGNQRATQADVDAGYQTFVGRFVDMARKGKLQDFTADELAQQGNPDAGCYYWNPFGNAIVDPDKTGNGDLPLGNRLDVYSHFTEDQTTTTRTSLRVADAVIAGDLFELPAGPLGFAAGLQWREEEYDVSRGANTILQPGEPADTFIFIPGGTVFDSDQDTFAAFAEAAIPITENLEAQLAVRYEDYGGAIGSSVDPKLALLWQAHETLAFRASASTTFHAPALNQQFSERTALDSISDRDSPGGGGTGAFGYVQQPLTGNPALKPETAVTYNAGFIWEPFDGFNLTADYYKIDFDDMIVTTNAQTILTGENSINAAKGVSSRNPWCEENGLPDSAPGCFVSDALVSRVPEARGAGEGGGQRPVVRIQLDFSNASSVMTDGIDVTSSYDWSMGGLGDFRWDFSGNHIIQYESTVPGGVGNIAGYANHNNSVYPLPKIRFNTGLRWMPDDISSLSLRARYITSFTDDRSYTACGETNGCPTKSKHKISAWTAWDLVYTRMMEEYNVLLTAGIENMWDQDPPFVYRDLNFDGRSGSSPLGRLFRFSMRYAFE